MLQKIHDSITLAGDSSPGSQLFKWQLPKGFHPINYILSLPFGTTESVSIGAWGEGDQADSNDWTPIKSAVLVLNYAGSDDLAVDVDIIVTDEDVPSFVYTGDTAKQ